MGPVLVTTDWLAEHLTDPGIVIVEVDEDTAAYDTGHLRGAVRLDWTVDLQDQLRRDLVGREQFEELCSRHGISTEHTVVFYGGNNNWFACYAFWCFALYGHPELRLLDGGRKKWEWERRELTTDPTVRDRTAYRAGAVHTEIRALRDEVLAGIGASNLVDVRSPDEYAGRLLAPPHLPQEQAQRAGHIPTAINVPWSRAVRDDGTFLDAGELREVYAELDWSRETIAYCRIGERSALTWFVLDRLLGQDRVKNYDGSWTEYGSLVGVPIAVDVTRPTRPD